MDVILDNNQYTQIIQIHMHTQHKPMNNGDYGLFTTTLVSTYTIKYIAHYDVSGFGKSVVYSLIISLTVN